MNQENIEKALLGFEDETESAELGAVLRKMSIPSTPANKIALNQFASQAIQKNILEKNLTKGQSLIIKQAENLELETRKNWNAGRVSFTDAEKYIRRDISLSAGMVDMFEDSVSKEVGVTNVSKGRLEDGENLMLERIEVNYDRGTGITTKTADFAPVTNTDDNALYNGELEVMSGGKSIVRIPVSSFCVPKTQGSPANGFNLKAPKLIKEKEEIQVRIHFAGTMNTGSDKDIIEVKLIGDSTKIR